jgi:hypothetical protein
MDSICEQSVAENGSGWVYVLSRWLERKSGTRDCHKPSKGLSISDRRARNLRNADAERQMQGKKVQAARGHLRTSVKIHIENRS